MSRYSQWQHGRRLPTVFGSSFFFLILSNLKKCVLCCAFLTAVVQERLLSAQELEGVNFSLAIPIYEDRLRFSALLLSKIKDKLSPLN